MQSGTPSNRSRMAASVTALVGLSVVSGCSPRAVSDVDRVQRPVAAPQPAVIPPVNTVQPPRVETVQPPQEVNTLQQPQSVFVTTKAIGEEDGTGLIPIQPNASAGQTSFDPLAPPPIGEVAGEYERIYIPPETGSATTLAIGEEG